MTSYEFANSLAERFCTRDPFEIADALGIILRRKNLGSLQGLYFLAEDQPYILINERLCAEKQRMICAHELGHDQLHRSLCDAVFSEHTLFDRSGKPEIEANLFAADLLLRDEDVLSALSENPDLASFASTLDVYPEFLLFKLKSMNSRGYDLLIPQECRNSFWNQ